MRMSDEGMAIPTPYYCSQACPAAVLHTRRHHLVRIGISFMLELAIGKDMGILLQQIGYVRMSLVPRQLPPRQAFGD